MSMMKKFWLILVVFALYLPFLVFRSLEKNARFQEESVGILSPQNVSDWLNDFTWAWPIPLIAVFLVFLVRWISRS